MARIFTIEANKDASATCRPTLLPGETTDYLQIWVSYQTRRPNPKAKEMLSAADDSSTFDMCRSGMNLVGLGYFSGSRAIALTIKRMIMVT